MAVPFKNAIRERHNIRPRHHAVALSLPTSLPEDSTMALAVRLRDDMVPEMTGLPQLSVRRESDPAAMARLLGKPIEEMTRRFAKGHRAYVGSWNGEPVGWGWVATREAEIGELRINFAIPEGERYLWNFVT